MKRENRISRLGFILLSAGCAIGIGNVWRFPYVAGQSGGGVFLLFYFIFLAVLGIPVLTMEFSVGRAARRSIAKLHGELLEGRPSGRWWLIHGVGGTVGNFVLMMFYTTVAGWMVIYFLKMAAGDFAALGSQEIEAAFGGMLGDWQVQGAAMCGVCVACALVCAIGLNKGLDRVVKWMMLALLLLIVVLAANGIVTDLRGEHPSGLHFLFVPDFARFREAGPVKVVVNAMNQAFFTLSLGIGAMAIFGSYIEKDRRLAGEALNVAALDTVVALSAGIIILPACFAHGVEPGQGPGLIFVTLPNVFNHMPYGRVWGALFFLFMCFAALSTVLAVFETIIACLGDYFPRLGRRGACAIVAVAMPLLSLPCIFGFNLWSSFQPFGEGSCVLDLEDFILSNLLLPLGAIAFVVFCTRRCGWGFGKFLAEANTGRGFKLSASLEFYSTWILPVIIFLVFAAGLLEKAGWI